MKKHLYEIKKLKIPAYLKWWFIQKKFSGTLSEIMENLSSPITLTDSLKRRFKIFKIGGNSIQDGEPSPTNEVPIKNVGDNINIFNKSSTPIYKDQVETQEIETGVRVTTRNTGTNHFGIYLIDTVKKLKGKDITASANIVPSSTNLGGMRFVVCDANGSNRTVIIQKNGITGKQSITCNIDNSYEDNKVVGLVLMSNISSASAGDYTDYEDLKVEKGTVATPYSPYNCGNVEVKVENGNLFDVGIDNSDYVTNSDTLPNYLTVNDKQLALVIQANGSACVYRKQNFQGNKDYSFKAISSKASGRIYIRIRSLDNTRWLTDSDLNIAGFTYNMYYKGWFLQVASTNMIKAFSIPECLYWQFGLGFSSSDVGTTQTISNIQLVEGTYTLETMPDYEPHEEQTAIFPLEEGQVLHKDDGIEDKIVQRRKTLVFDGTENWLITGYSVFYLTSITDYKISTGNICLCTHYISTENVGASSSVQDKKCCFINTHRSYRFYIKDTSFETVEEFKTFLAQQYANGTPVTAEYELETPIETPFTEAQRTAKAQIDSLHSYKGTTYISSSNDPSPLFTIQYVKEET